MLSHSITLGFRGLVLRSTATPRPIPKQAVASIQPQGTGVGPVLASRRTPFPSAARPTTGRRTAKAKSQAGCPRGRWEYFKVICSGQGGFWGLPGPQARGDVWFGKGQSLPETQEASKEEVSPFCTSWPDLTHTFIQQIFIQRLFVQGTSGEGGLQPGPLPPAPPRPAPPVAAPSALERWFWPDLTPEGRKAGCLGLCVVMTSTPARCRPLGLCCGRAPSPALSPPRALQALRAEGTATLGGLLHLLGKRGPVAALKGELPPLQPQALAAALART